MSPEKRPCTNGLVDRASELCAQWKAADAAEKAAWWAAFAGWFGGLSSLGVIVALGAAFHSNWIARDTAKRQLRAYIDIEPSGINLPKNGLVRAALILKNSGQTPAYDIMVFSRFSLSLNPLDEDVRNFNCGIVGELNDAALGPQSQRHVYPYCSEDFLGKWMDDVFNKRKAIVHFGYVSYKDAFGETRETRFAFYHWGQELSDENVLRCRFGNSAN